MFRIKALPQIGNDSSLSVYRPKTRKPFYISICIFQQCIQRYISTLLLYHNIKIEK